MRSAFLTAAGICLTGLTQASAQGCDSVWSRTSLAELNGRQVREVRIDAQRPASLPLLPALLDHLHVRTREATVRRLVLVAPGETLDTLRVAESLRRLRQLRYLTDPVALGTSCAGGPVDLTVITHDLWSMRPSLQLHSTSQALTLTDRNVFGTGREATIGVRSDLNGVALDAGVRDPWFLGRDLSLSLNATGTAERGARSIVAEKHEHSVLDPVGLSARIETSAFGTAALDTDAVIGIPVDGLRRMSGNAIASHRIRVTRSAVLHASLGAEYNRVEWEMPFDGPVLPIREFVGGDVGLRRRSVAYDTLTWYLPDNALVDVPLAFEFDALVGAGRDRPANAAALHADLWAGRMWRMGRKSLLVADVWGSGYLVRGQWSAATFRAGLTYDRAATRGLWTARAAIERWFGPDPDIRPIIAPADPTYRALEPDIREVRDAVAWSVERSMHVRRLTRSYTLDVGAFAAGSARAAAQVGALGAGLRLAPARLGRATARLDVGFPVLRSGEVRNRPYVAIGITPWLEQDRQRDGRRIR